MRRRRCLVLLALGSVLGPLTSCTCGGEPRGEDTGPPARPTLAARSFRLENGLEVELVSGPCGDQAAIAVLFAVGTDHDPAGRSGMAHLVERWMSAAAGPDRIVATGTDHTLDSVVFPVDRLEGELEAVAARMAPELTEAELARARAEVLEDLTNRHGGDAELTARSYAAESIQPTRGDGWRGGIAAEVEAIDLAQLQAFREAHFRPGNARMIVVGRFDPDAVRARIERAFAALPAGSPPVAREPADSTVRGTLVFGDAPSAVAVAVPAPPPSDALHPAFLILAARLMGSTSEAWQASYDPITRPETLFVTGPVQPAEQPESAAARIRGEMATALGRALTPEDRAAVRERFGLVLGEDELDPETCATDPRGLAIAHARRAQLGLEGASLAHALDETTPEQLAEAAALFEPARSAAVIAGGTIR